MKPEFDSQCGGPLASRDGWPRLPQPDPGETVAAFIDRAIDGDPFLTLNAPTLRPGETWVTLVRFANPGKVPVTFTPRVLSGAF